MTRIQKGVTLALVTSILYGLMPFFSVPLQAEGVNHLSNLSILFYRNLLGSLPLALIMLWKRISFRISLPELITLIVLAGFSDGAALFQIEGYPPLLPTGIATTIHFLYPVFTALIMMIFYKERCSRPTLVALFMAVSGVALLSWPTGDVSVKLLGIVFELLSAICFALYIVRLNHSRVSRMDGTKLTFYIIFIGSLLFAGEGLRTNDLQPLTTPFQWEYIFVLGIVCTAIVNLLIVISTRLIGSTIASMLGALEPLTAVIVGLLFMGESLTLTISIGILLVLSSVLLILHASKKTS